MNDPRGSVWRKWDLHIHTPDSLVHGYGGNGKDVWEKFIKELSQLPAEFKVLGINDYIFLDGYMLGLGCLYTCKKLCIFSGISLHEML